MRVVVNFEAPDGETGELIFPESVGGVLEISEIILVWRSLFGPSKNPVIRLLECDHVNIQESHLLLPLWERRDP